MEQVRGFAHANGLEVLSVDEARRAVVLSGSVAQLSYAFGVDLMLFHHQSAGWVYRGRTGPIFVPRALGPIVTGVFGLDDRPQVRPLFRMAGRARRAAATSFTPIRLARLYGFPQGVSGQGQTIGILEFGGGFVRSDLATYLTNLGIPAAAQPNVSVVSVDGGRNAPTGNPNGPDGEVMLDIEIVAAIAPGCRIVVYFAPNTLEDSWTRVRRRSTTRPIRRR